MIQSYVHESSVEHVYITIIIQMLHLNLNLMFSLDK